MKLKRRIEYENRALHIGGLRPTMREVAYACRKLIRLAARRFAAYGEPQLVAIQVHADLQLAMYTLGTLPTALHMLWNGTDMDTLVDTSDTPRFLRYAFLQANIRKRERRTAAKLRAEWSNRNG